MHIDRMPLTERVSNRAAVLSSVLFPAILHLLFSLGAAGLLASRSAAGVTLTVSCAASLTAPMQEIKALYLKQDPDAGIALNLGASGILQAQIEQGAPVDVFVSAGAAQVDSLVVRGFIERADVRILARNRLVLVVPSTAKVDAVRSLADLLHPEIRRIAIGSEKTVPAGQYAAQTLRKMDLLEKLGPKLVPGEDVRQVLQYVASGAAEAGFVYASDARSSAQVRVALEIPDETHEPIVYPIAPLAQSDELERARRFTDFAVGPDGQAVLRRYGFLPPPESRPEERRPER